MAGIIDIISSGVWSLISYLFGLAVIIMGLAYVAKPKEKTFQPYFKAVVASSWNIFDTKFIDLDINMKILSKTAEDSSKTTFQDYLILRVAKVNVINGDKLTFIGAFRKWFLITNDPNNRHAMKLQPHCWLIFDTKN